MLSEESKIEKGLLYNITYISKKCTYIRRIYIYYKYLKEKIYIIYIRIVIYVGRKMRVGNGDEYIN